MAQVYFDNFSPVGDLTVIATCIVIFLLLATSYPKKTKAYGVFLNMLVYLILAGLSDVISHQLYTRVTDGNYTAVYVMRVVYHIILYAFFLLGVVYISELQRLERRKRIPVMVISVVLFLGVTLAEVIITAVGKGFLFDESGKVVQKTSIFTIGYLGFIAIILFLMILFQSRLYKRVMTGFYGTLTISFWILLLQAKHGQSSFTVVSFLFPAIAMLYLVHCNPFDIETGSVSSRALEDTVRYNYKRKREMFYMSLYLPDFDVEGIYFPNEMQETIRRFTEEFFKDAVLFQLSNGHIVLFMRKDKNPDYMDRARAILEAFRVEHEKFHFDYKIVMGVSIDEISEKNVYASFIRSIHQKMNLNEVYMVKEGDVAAFEEYEYLLSELSDINKKMNMNDPRVLAYCQPVYNLHTGTYDTAEALMRLRLTKLGIVTPDRFISLAEKNGYIHVLTKIIMNKTCQEIGRLMREGYVVKRISVNVSIPEMRERSFSEEMSQIIKHSGIPAGKVAIEITESQSEYDFMMLKDRIDELKVRGIKFYLDDFGTGYSNMERILELPFDIIKFDRSLVIASNADERSRKIVGSMANLFAELNYSVLYEGVETQGDEERCVSMSASYLQGYKYSRPVPIEDLRNYFSKASGD